MQVKIEGKHPLVLSVSGELRTLKDVEILFDHIQTQEPVVLKCRNLEGNSFGLARFVERLILPTTPPLVYQEVGEFLANLFNNRPSTLRDCDKVESAVLQVRDDFGKVIDVCVTLDSAFFNNIALSPHCIEVNTPTGPVKLTENLEESLEFAFRRKVRKAV